MEGFTIEKALSNWLSAETWHTGHPADEKRFHRGLSVAFEALGPAIEAEKFEKAIRAVLAEKRPRDLKIRSEDVETYSQRAEDIGSYLFDLL